MKNHFVFAALLIGVSLFCLQGFGQPDSNWLVHDRNRPPAEVVDPGTASTPSNPGKPPSDAVVLFDGKNLSPWVSMDGNPTRWIVREGYMECVKGSGYIRTLQAFGDCQLHVEWAAPVPAEGEGQGRGNSGVFFGLGRYEIQVLDSYNNRTYTDGSAGSVYGQYPPAVNACRPPGQWQSYDIIWTSPRFDEPGNLLSPARITALHNGVLIQHNVELAGPTGWLELDSFEPHPEKLPIALQDHGNPVRFRNIWVRELGRPGRPEFIFQDALLDRYTGTYHVRPEFDVKITREDHQLIVEFGGKEFKLFAESKTKFFTKAIDIQIEFKVNAKGQPEGLDLSVGESSMPAIKINP